MKPRRLKTIPGRVVKFADLGASALFAIWCLVKRTKGWSWVKERTFYGSSGALRQLVSSASLTHGDMAVFPDGFDPNGSALPKENTSTTLDRSK